MLESCLNSLHAEGCGWDIGYLWRSMGWLSRGDLLLLGLMLANTIAIICYRAYCHRAARMQSRACFRDSAATLRDGRLDEVISIAMHNRRSHVAAVVAPVWLLSAPHRHISLTLKPSMLHNEPFGASARSWLPT